MRLWASSQSGSLTLALGRRRVAQPGVPAAPEPAFITQARRTQHIIHCAIRWCILIHAVQGSDSQRQAWLGLEYSGALAPLPAKVTCLLMLHNAYSNLQLAARIKIMCEA